MDRDHAVAAVAVVPATSAVVACRRTDPNSKHESPNASRNWSTAEIEEAPELRLNASMATVANKDPRRTQDTAADTSHALDRFARSIPYKIKNETRSGLTPNGFCARNSTTHTARHAEMTALLPDVPAPPVFGASRYDEA
jgi:hypothetical protein